MSPSHVVRPTPCPACSSISTASVLPSRVARWIASSPSWFFSRRFAPHAISPCRRHARVAHTQAHARVCNPPAAVARTGAPPHTDRAREEGGRFAHTRSSRVRNGGSHRRRCREGGRDGTFTVSLVGRCLSLAGVSSSRSRPIATRRNAPTTRADDDASVECSRRRPPPSGRRHRPRFSSPCGEGIVVRRASHSPMGNGCGTSVSCGVNHNTNLSFEVGSSTRPRASRGRRARPPCAWACCPGGRRAGEQPALRREW